MEPLQGMPKKILLRKCSAIETVKNELKNICRVEQSRHRSFTNFIVNIIAGLIAYNFVPKKPAIKFQKSYVNQIAAFSNNRTQVINL